MGRKRTIKAREVLRDIRSIMSDCDLMSKYDLSPSEFDSLLRHLIAADLVIQHELEGRRQLSDSQITRALVESC